MKLILLFQLNSYLMARAAALLPAAIWREVSGLAVITRESSSTRLFQKYDDDEDDDDDIPDVDPGKFTPPTSFYGLNRGRSSPEQRKALGVSGQATVYLCTECGSESVKWMGRCPTCRQWNTLQEFQVERRTKSIPRPRFGSGSINAGDSVASARPQSWLSGNDGYDNPPVRVTDVYQQSTSQERLLIPNDDELNQVLGGGILSGSLTLLGGDPGVGKSTLLLQTAGAIASLATPTVGIGMGSPAGGEGMGPVWYVSGEETASQIAGRAKRLGIESSELWLLRETHIDTLCDQVVASYQPHAEHSPKPPSLIVIDSIQTMVCDAGGASAAGGVTQVRECVALLLRLAKSTNIAVVIIGHVTKSGDVAGPKTVEHMVDVVLYLEGGDKVGDVNLRLLRAAKNRFGSGDAVGVYEMTSSGSLLPVTDPSSLLISGRMKDVEGCATSLVLEGLRCLTVEIQALVTPSLEQSGRRTVQGMAFSRLSLLLGVLRKRCGMYFGKQDTYINVVGNLRLDDDRTSDLAAAVALVSSLLTIPVRSDTAFCGEVGLLGELRHVSLLEKRLAEARRMGFSRVVAPGNGMVGTGAERAISRLQGVDWIQCNTLVEALNEGLVQRLPKRQRSRRQPGIRQASSPESLDELLLGEIIVDDEDLGFE